MRIAPRSAAGVAALVLGAVLAAAPGLVPAAGEMAPPMPEAAPAAGAAAVGDGARTGSPGERAEEHAGASGGRPLQDDTGGGAEGRAAVGHAPAGGSRLLRVLSEPPAPAGAPADDAAPAFAAEGCPRAVLRRLLAGAVDEAGALSALAIERELLALCRERQEIVTGLFETEARLRALRAPAAAAPSPARADTAAAVAAPATAAPAPARAAAAPASSPPSPLRAALAGAEEAPVDAEPATPRYGWFSIIGTAGALRAGVTDGSGVWFVREGDALPGGGTVAAIAGRPPGVRLSGIAGSGDETALSWRARPGGGP